MSTASQIKDRDLNIQIESFISKLKRNQITGSYDVAIQTSQLFVKIISLTRWSSLEQLSTQISHIGNRLSTAQPREFICGNIVKRILALIREEMEDEMNDIQNEEKSEQDVNSVTENSTVSSMFRLLTPKTEKKNPKNTNSNTEKSNDQRSIIIQGIRDLIDEIRNVDDGLETMSADLIHDNEVLLTPTPNSKTVLRFLKRARQKRTFTVLVTECFPNDAAVAHEFAKELADANIETVIIPDTTVFAVMSRVGKVIVGTRCVFANGGFVTASGVSAVIECAKEHRTPVFAVSGLYKLSPSYPFNIESLIEVGNSGKVIKFQENKLLECTDTANELYDYVPPENIDIFITNLYVLFGNFIFVARLVNAFSLRQFTNTFNF